MHIATMVVSARMNVSTYGCELNTQTKHARGHTSAYSAQIYLIIASYL